MYWLWSPTKSHKLRWPGDHTFLRSSYHSLSSLRAWTSSWPSWQPSQQSTMNHFRIILHWWPILSNSLQRCCQHGCWFELAGGRACLLAMRRWVPSIYLSASVFYYWMRSGNRGSQSAWPSSWYSMSCTGCPWVRWFGCTFPKFVRRKSCLWPQRLTGVAARCVWSWRQLWPALWIHHTQSSYSLEHTSLPCFSPITSWWNKLKVCHLSKWAKNSNPNLEKKWIISKLKICSQSFNTYS